MNTDKIDVTQLISQTSAYLLLFLFIAILCCALIAKKIPKMKQDIQLAFWMFLGFGVWLVYGIFIILYSSPISELSVEKSGQFGDSFGAITALFATLTFVVAVRVFFVQKLEFEKLTSKTEYNNKIQRAAIQPVFQIERINQADGNAHNFAAFMLGESHYQLANQNAMPFFNAYAENNTSGTTSTETSAKEIFVQHRDELTRGSEIYIFYTDLSGYKTKLTLGFGHEWQAFENEATKDDDEIIQTVIVDRDNSLGILSIEFLDS